MMFKYWQLAMITNYSKFDGRASRAEYWWPALVNIVIGLVLSLLSQASVFFLVIYVIFSLALLIPSLAVTVRRLHDTGRSGWWILIALIPIIGAIVLIVFLASEGSRGANQYGPPPAPLMA